MKLEGSLLHGVQTQLHQNDPDSAFKSARGSEQLFSPVAPGTSKSIAGKELVMKQSYRIPGW